MIRVEPLFRIRMVLDDAVLNEFAVQKVLPRRRSIKGVCIWLAAFLIVILLISAVSKKPVETLIAGVFITVIFAVQGLKRCSPNGQKNEIARQVEALSKNLASGELGTVTVYDFLENEMSWDNDRSNGTMSYADMKGVVETEKGFLLSIKNDRRILFWKTAFITGNPMEFKTFLEQRMRNNGSSDLDRFIKAQNLDYETALAEIKSGHKRSH